MTQMEILELAMEQGNMVQVLMVHCETMKRQQTRLRFATALLFATFLATLAWMQFHQQTKDAISGARSEALISKPGSPKRSLCVNLKPAQSMIGACPAHQRGERLIQWRQMNDGDGDGHQNFNLKNRTVLTVLSKGLYLINLRILYRISPNQCNSTEKATLVVKVTQQHSNYGKEIEVKSAVESMSCTPYWLQSITVSKAITLEADTDLRVKINSETCKFVDWAKNSHLDVIYLS